MHQLQKQTFLTVRGMLEQNAEAIADSIPKHVSLKRLARVALSELRTTPKLLECSPASLVNAIEKAAQVGLEVGSAMGHAYLVPYKTEATLIIGYRGLISLARRSGEILSIQAQVVRAGDEFEFEYGFEEKLRHVPSLGERGEITHAYAVAKLKDGGVQFDVMTKAEVDQIRNRSRASGAGPWVTDYPEMARKTLVRRLFKYLPVSIEMADALAADDDRDSGEINITPAEELTERLLVSVPHENGADIGVIAK